MRNYGYSDDLLDEAEFGRLVSYSKNLADTAASGFSTIGGSGSGDSLPQSFGEFQLLRVIGKSNSGTTYLATKQGSKKKVVIKKISPALIRHYDDDELNRKIRQLREESAALNAVDPPNVSILQEIGKEDGQVYQVQDYLEGRCLQKLVTANALSNREAAETLMLVASALYSLHKAGILHRDLRPSKIFLDEDKKPHLVEPGAAILRPVGENDFQTPSQFRAPEVAVDRLANTAAAEIWALGAILYNCLVGEPPNASESATKAPILPRKRNPRVARDLETICLKCLQTQPSKRYPDAAALAEDLDLFLEYQPINAQPSGWFGRLVNRISRLA